MTGLDLRLVRGLLLTLLLLFGCSGDPNDEELDSTAQALCTGVTLSAAPSGLISTSTVLTATAPRCAAGE
jgi:hypothetical protein